MYLGNGCLNYKTDFYGILAADCFLIMNGWHLYVALLFLISNIKCMIKKIS